MLPGAIGQCVCRHFCLNFCLNLCLNLSRLPPPYRARLGPGLLRMRRAAICAAVAVERLALRNVHAAHMARHHGLRMGPRGARAGIGHAAAQPCAPFAPQLAQRNQQHQKGQQILHTSSLRQVRVDERPASPSSCHKATPSVRRSLLCSPTRKWLHPGCIPSARLPCTRREPLAARTMRRLRGLRRLPRACSSVAPCQGTLAKLQTPRNS